MISRVKEEDLETVQRDTTYAAISNGDILGHEWSLYAEDDISLGRFRVNAGIHLSYLIHRGRITFLPAPFVGPLWADRRGRYQSFVHSDGAICSSVVFFHHCFTDGSVGAGNEEHSPDAFRSIRIGWILYRNKRMGVFYGSLL